MEILDATELDEECVRRVLVNEIIASQSEIVSIILLKNAIFSGVLSQNMQEVGDSLLEIITSTSFTSLMLIALRKLIDLPVDEHKKEEWLFELVIHFKEALSFPEDGQDGLFLTTLKQSLGDVSKLLPQLNFFN